MIAQWHDLRWGDDIGRDGWMSDTRLQSDRDRDGVGYELVAEVADGDEPYEQAATAAIMRTPDGKYWAGENDGGGSGWEGVDLCDVTGPYETIGEALAAISEPLRELFPADLLA